MINEEWGELQKSVLYLKTKSLSSQENILFKQFTLAGVFFTFPILSCKNNSTLQLFQY